MSREYSFFNSKYFSLKTLFFAFTFLGLAALFIPTSVQAIDSAKKGSCSASGFITTHSSPFSSTSKQCIGQLPPSDNNTIFQFAVELPIANSSTTVTAKNGTGTTIPFVKQSTKLFVSKPSDDMGYKGSVPVDGVSACNSNDGVNKITITVKAGGETETFSVDLCQNKTTYVIGKTATIPKADDSGTAAPTNKVGCLKGNIGLVRDDPTPSWTTEERNAKLQQSGVTYIKVSGPTAREVSNSGDIMSESTKKWLSLENGLLTIKDLTPGSYTVVLKYNDKINIVNDIGPNADTWTTSEATFNFEPTRVYESNDCAELNDGNNYLISTTTGKETAAAGAVDTSTDESSCKVEGVGWIVCPVISFMASISDGAFSVIEGMLNVNTQLLDTNSGTYTAWAAFRNIANVAFVIAFLIIIYSQLTSVGISNYGVKKTLPRLIVTVVLVNVSFFLCQLAVDVTQIIGASVGSFLQSIPVGECKPIAPATTCDTANLGISDFIGDVLSGAAVLGVLAGGAAIAVTAIALGVSTPVLLAVLIAVLMTVVILVGRQAGIVILIALAPLAFVANLLPNTESWFKKWYKMFIALLMVYPIIAVLYGGGALASKILANVAAESDGPDQFLLALTAIGVSAVPLLMTPSLLKGALSSMGSVGGKLSGFASKANSGVGKAVNSQSRFGEAKQGLKNKFALNRANSRAGSKYQKAIDQSSVGKMLGLDKGTARALKAVEGEQETEVANRVAQIQHDTSSTDRVEESSKLLKAAIASGDVTTARAAQKILLGSGMVGLTELQKVYSDKQVAGDMVRQKEVSGFLRSELNSAGLKGKNNALARYGYEGPADVLSEGYTAQRPKKDAAGNIMKDAAGRDIMESYDVKAFAEDAATFKKLNAVELAGQTTANLERAKQHISKDAAAAALDNSAASALLDDEKRQLLSVIAGRAAPPPTPPSVRERAQARADAAARGTQGTDPIPMPGRPPADEGTLPIRGNNGTPPPTPPAGS